VKTPLITIVVGVIAALGLFLVFRTPAGEKESSTRPQVVAARKLPAATIAEPGRGWKAPNREIARDPTDSERLARSMIEQGDAALADGDMKHGFDAYRRAVEYFPSAETHAALGGLYLKSAALSDAEFHLRRAAELDAYNPDRWLDLANVHFLKQDPVSAWKLVAHAKTIAPDIEIERDESNFVVRANAG
jgi:tetratricopeptide (TPR) repeat protein